MEVFICMNRLTNWLSLLNHNLKRMILRFINFIQGQLLITYHIIIDFETMEKNPTHFRIELLAEIRDWNDLCNLRMQLQEKITNKFILRGFYEKEIKTIYEKQRIEEDFNVNYKNHVSMKFIFRQWKNNKDGNLIKVIDNTIEQRGVKDYRVNILKSGKLPFYEIEDMFCIEIETTDLKEKAPQE